MQDLELRELWKTSNERVEIGLGTLELHSDEIKGLKLQHYLSSMKPIKIFTIVVGLGWVGIGIPILFNIVLNSFEQANKFFLFSAITQVLITLIALIVYIYQLVSIYNINISETVLKTQKDLANLQSSTLWVTRILFLQLPIWTIFYWNETMLQNENWFLLGFRAFVTLTFTYLAIWLFLNIKYENNDKKWFKLIFDGKEWTPLMESMKLLKEIETE